MNPRFSGLVKSQLRRVIQFADAVRGDAFDATMPINPAVTDFYLVGYPRSGNVWFGFMLGNVNLLMSGIDRRMTLFGGDDVIPSLEISRDIPIPSIRFPGFRMIQCHSAFNPKYKRVILLVRNPIDVMASHYKFSVELGMFSGNVRQFVDHPGFGIAAWVSHTTGWLDGAHANRFRASLCVIKYEELRNDPVAVLREIYLLLGFELADTVIATAVERASFAVMKADEVRLNARNPAWGGLEHARKEQTAGPRVPIDPELAEKIRKSAQPVLDRLGYH
jgi:Sulfotransferase domain